MILLPTVWSILFDSDLTLSARKKRFQIVKYLQDYPHMYFFLKKEALKEPYCNWDPAALVFTIEQ